MTKKRRVSGGLLGRICCPVLLVPFSLSLTNCSADDDVVEAVDEEQRQVYLSEGYGYVATFDEQAHEAKGYAVVDGKCWEQPVPAEIWWTSPRDAEILEFDYLGQKQPPITFVRVESFQHACPQGTLKTALDDDFEIDFELEYELFQRTFAEQYAFFDLREVDWSKQVAAAKEALKKVSSLEDFFAILSDSVAPLKDGHIVVQAGDELVFSESERPDIITSLIDEAVQEGSTSQEDVEKYMGAQFEAMGAALESYFLPSSVNGTLEDPVLFATIISGDASYGYFRISTFAEVVEGSVDDNISALDDLVEAALSSWGEVDGVIVDVRINDGGWDVLGRSLVSHFLAAETHVYSKRVMFNDTWSDLTPISVSPSKGARYEGPVVVLTSATTISAAETFTMAMSAIDGVTLVGEETHGILSDSLPKFLPSGIFFSLSNEEYQDPAGNVFERVGIPPDVAVEVLAKADRDEGRDQSIEAALAVFESVSD